MFVGLLCAITWATSSIMLRDLSRKLDPFTLNAPRTLVGGVSMLILALASGRTTGYQTVTPDKLLFMLASVGIGGGIGDVCYLLSLARIGASRAFPIASVYPSFTLILALLFLNERVTTLVATGLVLVVIGVALVGRPQRGRGLVPPEPERFGGVGYALGAAVCWGGSMVLLAKGVEGLDSIMVSSIRVPALSLLLWAVVACRRTWPKLATLTRKEWVLVILGGLIGWGLGSLLFVLSVALAGPTRAAILTSTSPLFALPMSVVFLKERATPHVLVGTALTVAGVVLVS